MDSKKIGKFLHEAWVKSKVKFGKVAILLHNASYHMVMNVDTPNSNGPLEL